MTEGSIQLTNAYTIGIKLRAQLRDGTSLEEAIASEASFRRPVTAAIDITTVPYYGDVEGMPMVSGLTPEDRAFKFATLSIVGRNIPLVLAVEPVRESSAWDENPSNQVHRTVGRLVRRAKEHAQIETVLCDREFDSMRVYQTLSNLGVNYLIPKRIASTEQEAIETMAHDNHEVAVESAVVDVESGSHPMRFLYVPSTKGDRTAVFATNLTVLAGFFSPVSQRSLAFLFEPRPFCRSEPIFFEIPRISIRYSWTFEPGRDHVI